MSCKKGTYVVRDQKGRCLNVTWGLPLHVPEDVHLEFSKPEIFKLWSRVLIRGLVENVLLAL